MTWAPFEIFATDALAGFRNSRRRLSRHASYTVWSIILLLTAFGALVWLISSIVHSEEIVSFPLDMNEVLFLFFMVFLGKSVLDVYHFLVERPATAFLLVQPISRTSIVIGKLLSVTVFNLGLLAMGLGLITGMTFLHQSMHFVIPPSIIITLILLSLLASSSGLTYSIMSGLRSWRRKMLAALGYSPVISAIYIIMLQTRLGSWELVMYLLIIYLISLTLIPISSALLLESWNTMTSSKGIVHSAKRKDRRAPFSAFLGRFFGTAVISVFEREVRTLLRRREGVGNAITLAGLLIFAFYFYSRLEEFVELPGFVLGLVPPIVVGLSLYLAVVMLCLVPALGAVSRDGKAAWIFKVAPIRENEIIQGKALAVLLMLPFIILFVALPIPLLTGLSPISLLFSSLGAVTMCATCVGLGIWFGAKYPNFDEASGNAPDVMTMYTMMMLCLFLTCVLLIPPLAIAYVDKLLAILLLILSVDISLFILIMGTRGAAKAFGKMEVLQ